MIYSTIFATFTFFVSILLYHNLDSSMLKCEGSLTFSRKSIQCEDIYTWKIKSCSILFFNHLICHMANQNPYSYIFSHFKKFHPFLLVTKQTFLVQTMTFHSKLPSHYVFQNHTKVLKLSDMLIKPALQNHIKNI